MHFRFLFLGLLCALAPPPIASAATTTRTEARVVVPGATLNGQPFELILDTGSDSPLVTESLLQRLGLAYAPPPRSTPASPGSIALGVSNAADLAIGAQPFHLQLPVVALPGLEGLLGWPEVRKNILVFDASQRVIRSVSVLPPEMAGWQKFKLGPDFALTFLVPLPNGSNGTIMIDTGAYHGVSLSPARWHQWRAEHPQAPLTAEPYTGISIGTGIKEEAFADEISLGAFSLTDIMIGDSTPFEIRNFENYIGTLGLEALIRMDLVVDGVNGFLYLRPKPPADADHSLPKSTSVADWTLEATVSVNLDGLYLEPGWYYLLTGNFKAAIASWEGATEKFPGDAVAWACLGWARQNTGDATGAAQAYQRARMAAPGVAAMLRGNGSLLQSKGDNMRAIVNYEISLAVLPEKGATTFETKTLDTPGHGDEAQLNVLGRDGWELIRWGASLTPGWVHYVFQRPTPAPINDQLKILSAKFGAAGQEADVTATVAALLGSEPNEFFVAEKWLEVDPAPGLRKALAIAYEYNGRAYTFTAAENESVSRALLVERALGRTLPGSIPTWNYAHDRKEAEGPGWSWVAPGGRPSAETAQTIFKQRSITTAPRNISLVSAYFGLGGHFADVTPLVANLFSQPAGAFAINPDTFKTDPAPGMLKFLLITYTLDGVRQHFTAGENSQLSRETLLEDATLGADTYARLYRQILQMRLDKAPADFMLTVSHWPESWAKSIGQFLAGVIDEKALFAAAQRRDLETVAGQLCEAYYFAGMKHLIDGDLNTARDYFQKSVDTGIKDYNEYRFSAAELARLSGTPSLVSH